MNILERNVLNPYYKDRDFPEVKVSNADIVAVIKNPNQLQRVIEEHNTLVDMVHDYEDSVEILRQRLETVLEAAQDFFDGTEEDRGHEPEWKILSETLERFNKK